MGPAHVEAANGQTRSRRRPGIRRTGRHRPDTGPAVISGYKAARNRPLTRGQRLSDKAPAAVRAPVEHGFAHLKNWRVLGKVRTDPAWATALVRALLVLTNREISR
ncbi:transposase family protein [Streptomyces sp. NY05-11A]|uniref:transposase family protein n=1 Tax=Streptomyces soliscabiei TaxID=588897 RepID=UPI003B99943F